MRGVSTAAAVLFASIALAGCSAYGPCCRAPCRAVEAGPAPRIFAVGEAASSWGFLRRKYDADGDGAVSAREYGRGEKAFANLDRDGDGRVTAEDFAGASRMDEYVVRATIMRYFQADDAPADLALAELEEAFARHDGNGDGRLGAAELERARAAVDATSTSPVPAMPAGVDAWKSMRAALDRDGDGAFSLAELRRFFAAKDDDDDGVWALPQRKGPRPARARGPAPGTEAPDFTLRPPGGGEAVTLSSFRGRKPVALIFGSWT